MKLRYNPIIRSLLLIIALLYTTSVFADDAESKANARIEQNMELIKQRSEIDTLKFNRLVNETMHLAQRHGRDDIIPDLHFYSIGYKLANNGAVSGYNELKELKAYVEKTGKGYDQLYRSWQNVIIQFYHESNPLRAMSEYHEMNDMAEKANDYVGLARSAISLGCIAEYAYDEGVEQFNLALDYARLAGQREMDYFIYYQMAMLAYQNEKYDDVIRYTTQVMESDKKPAEAIQYVVPLNLLTYMDINDEDEAYKYYLTAKELWDNNKVLPPFISEYAKTLCLYESKYGNTKEANKYLSYIQEPSERLKAEIAYNKAIGNYRGALEATERYDSIEKALLIIGQKAKVANANAFYNMQQLKGMNQRMKMENVRNIMMFVMLILILLLIASFFIYFSVRRHNKQLKDEKELTEEQRKLAEQQKKLAEEQKHIAQEERRKAEEERNNAVRLSEMKTTFLNNMSHEMRTPLNSIIGFNDLLNNSDIIFTESKRQEMVEHINFHSRQLMRLIDHATILSRIDGNDAKPVPSQVYIPDLLKAINDEYSEIIPDDVDLDISQAVNSSNCVTSDTEFVRNILRDVIDNAIKFTKKGKVTVTSQAVNNGTVEVIITDQGPGIPKEKVNQIYNRFEKLNVYEPGFGLGLSCCKELLEIIHGSIKIDPEYKNGARFIITLTDMEQPK